jgi:hypothetical protein
MSQTAGPADIPVVSNSKLYGQKSLSPSVRQPPHYFQQVTAIQETTGRLFHDRSTQSSESADGAISMMLIRTRGDRPSGDSPPLQGIREYDEEVRGGGKRLTGLLGFDRAVHREQVTKARVQGIRPSLCLRVVPVFIEVGKTASELGSDCRM